VNEFNVLVWTKQLTKIGKPYEGHGVKIAMIEKYREAWDKIITAIREGEAATMSAPPV
jgi:hypothetical protein